jgi:hypothetical protein
MKALWLRARLAARSMPGYPGRFWMHPLIVPQGRQRRFGGCLVCQMPNKASGRLSLSPSPSLLNSMPCVSKVAFVVDRQQGYGPAPRGSGQGRELR